MLKPSQDKQAMEQVASYLHAAAVFFKYPEKDKESWTASTQAILGILENLGYHKHA